MNESLNAISGCFVTASSGCHRYNYWNEQALFDGRPDTGWCTPRRRQFREEYLEIDLGRFHTPRRIRLQARPIQNWPGFPRRVRVLSRADTEWVPVMDAVGVAADAGQWWDGDLSPRSTDSMRIEFDEVGWRSNGSYFVQFMQLELLEGVAR